MMQYEAVIGLEVHVQVRTESKMFCSCANRFGAEPNTLVCPVCMGYPGVLPVPNREAIRQTVRAGLMTRCRIASYSKFDRKSYFYPDMPKNYQISQYDLPFCEHGGIDLEGTGFSGAPLPRKTIGITRIHLEEDVAKLTHFGHVSGVDYNRAGVPLMEVVSEPDMRSADEAYAYLTNLKEIIRFGGIGDCDMEKGQMRCDVNISLRPVGETKFGTKIELKNLNSFRAVHRAIDYEIARQAEILDGGGAIRQETRGWNDDRGESYLMRTKESANDYRYFPDPDLMPVAFDEKELAELAAYFDRAARAAKNPKAADNWIITELLRLLGEEKTALAECKVKPEQLARLTDLVGSGAINGKTAKEVFAEIFATGKDPEAIIKAKGLSQVSDAGAIGEVVAQALAANPKQVAEYKAGNEKVIQYLMGQVMRLSRGRANPQVVMAELRKQLSA